MAKIKYTGEEALARVADYVNKKLTFVSSMPESPDANTIVLYVGGSTASYLQGGIYEYDGTNWNLINSVQQIELTKAEYDVLPVAIQENGTIYFITDIDAEGSVVGGYYNVADGEFYEEFTYETKIAGNANVLYIDKNSDTIYIYNTTNEEYVQVSSGSVVIKYVQSLPASGIQDIIYGYDSATNYNETATNGFLDNDNNFIKVENTYIAADDIKIKASADNITYKSFESLIYDNINLNFTITYTDTTNETINEGDIFYWQIIDRNYFAGNAKEQSLTIFTNTDNKADKVIGAVNGNFAGLDANGNLTDSGKNSNNFVGQVRTMPTASSALSGKIYQFIGTTNNPYIHGYFYECVEDNGSYLWENILVEANTPQIQSDWDQTDNTQKDFIKNKPTIPDAQVNSDWTASSGVAEILHKPTLGTASALDVAENGDATTSQVVKGNDTRLTDSRNAADVYSWAKAENKPSYTATEVGAIASTEKGANNGVAELDNTGKVPSSQLPSYVDDVLEYNSQSAFPITGETGKIYIAKDTNKTYRWSGTAYVEISESLALGETSSTAYAGNKGKANADAITAIKDGTTIDSFSDVETALDNKADKVTSATSGNLAGLDANGNLTDSGKKPSDILKLGTSSSTAYRGDRGNTAYSHASDSSKLTTATATGLYKVGSTAQGHIAGLTAIEKADITGLGIPAQDTTYESKTAASGGTDVSLVTTGEKYTWNNKADKVASATNGDVATLDANGNLVDSGKTLGKTVPSNAVFTDANVTQTPTTTNATYEVLFSNGANNSSETKAARKNSNLTFNPSTGQLTTDKVVSILSSLATTGTGVAGEDKGSGVSPRYFPGTWTFNIGKTPVAGDMLMVKVPVAANAAGIYMSVDNGTTYKPVVLSGTAILTGQGFAANVYVLMVYEPDSTASAYDMSGADSKTTITGVWRIVNYYDSNTTYSKMSQSEATTGTATSARTISAEVLNTTITNKIADKQDKLTAKGSATKGIYVDSNGALQNMTYSVSKNVPSDAVFTDTKDAASLTYSNTTSGLTATKVQDAIDEVNDTVVNLSRNADGTSKDISSMLSNLPQAISERNLAKYGYKIGDFFKPSISTSNYTYILADLDTFYGGTAVNAVVNTHHLGILVNTKKYSKYLASGTLTSYENSTLHTYLTGTVLENVKTDMIELFGGTTGLEHLVSHKTLYPTTTDLAWTADQYITAMTEVQVYGCPIYSMNAKQQGEGCRQLELFRRVNWVLKFGNNPIWLRSIAESDKACRANVGFPSLDEVTDQNYVVGLILFK